MKRKTALLLALTLALGLGTLARGEETKIIKPDGITQPSAQVKVSLDASEIEDVYEWVIPGVTEDGDNTVTLDESGVIGTLRFDDLVLDPAHSLTVTVSSGNNFVLTHTTRPELTIPYNLVSEGNGIRVTLNSETDSARTPIIQIDQGASTDEYLYDRLLTVVRRHPAEYIGTYTDTLTFTLTIDRHEEDG